MNKRGITVPRVQISAANKRRLAIIILAILCVFLVFFEAPKERKTTRSSPPVNQAKPISKKVKDESEQELISELEEPRAEIKFLSQTKLDAPTKSKTNANSWHEKGFHNEQVASAALSQRSAMTWQEWRDDPTIKEWKKMWRKKVTTAIPEDLFGPPEGYPCSDTCGDKQTKIDNTVCPMMHPVEQRLLLGTLTKTSVVWEWGTGISTMYYSQCAKQWTSIEHDTAWCEQMRSLRAPNVDIFCVPIEAKYKQSFGSPGTWDGSRQEFLSYVRAAEALKQCDGCVDIAIVDGRARADCAIEILPYLREDSYVFIHDWMPSRFGPRDHYDKVLAYYTIVEQVDTPAKNSGRAPSGLVKLTPKPAARRAAREKLGLAVDN